MSNDKEIQNKLRSELTGAEDSMNVSALLNRFADRSAQEGVLDVGYDELDSPVGRLFVAVTSAGVVRISFLRTEEGVLDDVARRVSPRVLRLPRLVDGARRQLDEYFEGKRHEFDIPLDRRLSSGFYKKVLDATLRIPYGQTGSYQGMAEAAGNSKASRAAGSALATNPIPIIVPCHRVLRSDDSLGGFGGGLDAKRLLLDLERSHADT